MSKKPFYAEFSHHPWDQQRLSMVGGKIVRHKGREKFQFESFEHFKEYMSLNDRREAHASGTTG